ncbi:hypothetical protein BG60_34325 [Caballeronia zhejiangensis]|jgi:hypothetical protein|uniref:Uncharacterized protein n=1 Tax=Caballeronia zhejiangensis TaxID=871203 RepID=A0A656QKR5_9BURK|nr:hypothetical protein BURK_031959 [Burkholderia sp. SJ98]KDR31031.1 hypothetical protein BG60_34325 [Caballeronia zhejiangensis]
MMVPLMMTAAVLVVRIGEVGPTAARCMGAKPAMPVAAGRIALASVHRTSECGGIFPLYFFESPLQTGIKRPREE